MAAAGHGRILGVTSGSGWRPADAGAYSCAKRAVASLTWQLGRVAPPGVVVNAMSPIAVTRMVTAALAGPSARRRRDRGRRVGDRRALARLDADRPSDLGPLGAYLVGDDFSWCRGQIMFAGGSEVGGRRPAPAARGRRAPTTSRRCRTCSRRSTPACWCRPRPRRPATAAATPASGRSSTSRRRRRPPAGRRCARARSCTDRPRSAAAVTAAARRPRGVGLRRADRPAPARRLRRRRRRAGRGRAPAVRSTPSSSRSPVGRSASRCARPTWEQVLAEHAGIVERASAPTPRWARAVVRLRGRRPTARPAGHAHRRDTAGGRSRAQAAAQLARAPRTAHRRPGRRVRGQRRDGRSGDRAGRRDRGPPGVQRRDAATCPGPSWWSAPGGSGCAATRTRRQHRLRRPGVPGWFDGALRRWSAPRGDVR